RSAVAAAAAARCEIAVAACALADTCTRSGAAEAAAVAVPARHVAISAAAAYGLIAGDGAIQDCQRAAIENCAAKSRAASAARTRTGRPALTLRHAVRQRDVLQSQRAGRRDRKESSLSATTEIQSGSGRAVDGESVIIDD